MFLQNFSHETLFFMGVILFCTIFWHSDKYYNEKVSEQAPTILTTLGIFATFFAIALGLYRFDSANIQHSVPELLNSMKTAFWASVFGVFGALTFKIRSLFFDKDKEIIDESNFHQRFLDEFKDFKEQNNTNINALIIAQNNALAKIGESSSEALIEALESVISDFNTKINEQFGENFKQLNEAVGKLLVWQEQYTDYIETSTSSLDEIIVNLNESSDKFDDVVNNSEEMSSHMQSFVDNAEAFAEIAESLETTLGNLNEQRDAIQTQLMELSKLVNDASNNLPQIENQILGIATTMQQSAGKFNQEVENLAKETRHQTNDLTKGIEEALKTSLSTLGGQLSSMTAKFAEDYNQLANALQRISQTTQNNTRW